MFFTNKKKDFDPTKLAYVELDERPSIFSSSPDAKPPVSPGSSPTAPIAFVLLVIGLAAGGFYGFQHFQNSNQSPSTKNTVALTPSKPPQKVLGIVDSVRKQVSDLPTDETPTVATVTNLAKLQGQAFFAKAQKGDKVLIYENAKKAYLYRPSTNAIIQVSEVEVAGDTSSAATASAETTSSKSGKPVLKIKF